MEGVSPTGAGLDVHQKFVPATCRPVDAAGNSQQAKPRFGTMPRELERVVDWLVEMQHDLRRRQSHRFRPEPYRATAIDANADRYNADTWAEASGPGGESVILAEGGALTTSHNSAL